MMSVLIAGGGTGGHLYPGIALAQELRHRDPNSRILFVGTPRGIEKDAVPKAGFDLALVPVSGLRRQGVMGLLRGLLRLPWSFVRAWQIVRGFKPNIAVSVGGYAAGPAVLAARLMGIPCVVMEQNAIPGFTNRVLGHLAKRVVASIPVKGFRESKVAVLGNPVRRDLLPVRAMPYEPHQPLHVLVFGGSQGAVAINERMVDAAPRLEKLNVRIVHQTGPRNFEHVREAYAQKNITAIEARPYIDDMASAYRDADVVICRAGATTIAELAVCGRPSILIPFPGAVDDHQTKNAQAMAEAGAAILIAQRDLSADDLADEIEGFCNDPQRLIAMAAASKSLGKPQAAEAIADCLRETAGV